jgi:hypothetical protein
VSEPDLRDPRLDEAYRRIPGDEPPPELDERIRAAARRAVAAKPESLAARGQRSWAARWRVPLSLAATVVVAATVTLMVQEEERRAFEDAPARAPAPAAPAVVETPAPSGTPEQAKPRDAPQRPPAVKPAVPGRAAPPPTEVQRAPAADAAAPPPPELEKLESRRQRREEPEAAGVFPASPPAPAPTPKPRAPQPSAAPPAAAPSGVSPALSRERAAGERPARETRSAPEPSRSPEQWIEEIRRLKAQGRDTDAAAELAEFRRRYPNYPLPVDLAR